MNDYFSALLRAAGTPQRPRFAAGGVAAPHAADVALGNVFDPFDAAPDSSALPAAPDEGQATQGAVSANPHAAQPAHLRDEPSVAAPAARSTASAPPAPLPALGRHAPPSLQAALRWVAAGGTHGPSAAAAADNALPVLQASSHNATQQAPTQANDATARSVADAPRASHAAFVARTDASSSHTARPFSVQPQHPVSAPDDGLHHYRLMPTANAAPQRRADAAAAAPVQVHIGTLHVTLDAAATARFAAKPASTTPADPTPRAPRGHDTRQAAHGGAHGINAGSASALSRSRLPRF